jgi:exosortase A-associated hydrolase 2
VTTSTAAVETSPFFLPGIAGDLFSVCFEPRARGSDGHAVLFCPPFAEEMNKSRRMVALQARALAERGIATLVLDLYGTGDSAGDFGAARWDIWRDDLQRGARWLRDRGYRHISLWGLRGGALLAAQCARELGTALDRILLWHPVARGEQMMTQFLRLRLAADLVADGEKITTQQLRETLLRGEPVEVAGYLIAPDLLRSLDAADLKSDFDAASVRVGWFEVAPTARALIPASRAVVDAWAARGLDIHTDVVVGESFWNTPEIALLPELIDRSTNWLCGAGA